MQRKIIGYNITIEPALINQETYSDDPQIVETPATKKLHAFVCDEAEALEAVKKYFEKAAR